MFCSGYGVYKSYKTKPNYLKGFVGRRIFPLILAYYSTGIIFLIARVLLKEKMDVPQFLYYLFGLQLSNPNTWYVIAMPFLYLCFYLAFKFCKKERTAILLVCVMVFLYTLLGTFIDHNNWWMRGEWWYNSVHFFTIGLLFARHEGKLLPVIKKYYYVFLIVCLVLVLPLYGLSEYAQGTFSYYGENFHAPDKVFRRWVCLASQIACSCAFVFSVFLLGLKVKIGNRFIRFMGTITLEFYLIHGLFLELFSYSFANVAPSIYYVKNVALLVLIVFIPSIPAALLLQKLHKKISAMVCRNS